MLATALAALIPKLIVLQGTFRGTWCRHLPGDDENC